MSDQLEENNSLSNSLSPILPSTLEFHNIDLSLKSPSTNILKKVSGFSNPYEVLAIMGPSGCGKTSLLSVLSDQIPDQSNFNLSGSIQINKKPIDSVDSSKMIRYVSQENMLFECLTPYELLHFTQGIQSLDSEVDVKEKIDSLITDFELSDSSNTIIGGNLCKGLNKGEKKKVAIAVEALKHPSILILDEPTSGLDSSLASSIMSSLRMMSSNGVNVILTFNQPDTEIYQMIDRLILMQEGRFIYQGERTESEEYFKSIGYEIPKTIEPPDYYMTLMKSCDRNALKDRKILSVLYENYDRREAEIWTGLKQIKDCNETYKLNSVGMIKVIRYLFWREVLSYTRNPVASMLKLVQLTILGILHVLVFSSFGFEETALDYRKDYIFSVVFLFYYTSEFTVALNMSFERRAVFKDIQQKYYSACSYFTVKVILEVLIMLVISMFYLFLVYHAIELNNENLEKISNLMSIVFHTYFHALALGYLVASFAVVPVLSPVLIVAFSMATMVLSGIILNPDADFGIEKWMKYSLPLYYLRNELDDLSGNNKISPDRFDLKEGIDENLIYSGIVFVFTMVSALTIYNFMAFHRSIKLKEGKKIMNNNKFNI